VVADGVYRYVLRREWDHPHHRAEALLWIMLNPSTADAVVDDPTIRRVRGFSERWGFGRCVVVNLFALRATSPRLLARHDSPIGPDNDMHILRNVEAHDAIVVAWGSAGGGAVAERARRVVSMLCGKAPVCLGTTLSGDPRHPLYVRGDQPLVSWCPG